MPLATCRFYARACFDGFGFIDNRGSNQCALYIGQHHPCDMRVRGGLEPDERVCPTLTQISILVRPGLRYEPNRAEVVFNHLQRRALEQPKRIPGPAGVERN